MAPKREVPKAAPEIEGPAIYTVYSVARVSAVLAEPDKDAEAPAAQEQPLCTVTLTTPTHALPCVSSPCASTEFGSYLPNYTVEHKCALSDAWQHLHKLLNNPLLVQVAVGGTVVGTAELDLLPAATEAASTIHKRLPLVPVDGTARGQTLRPEASVTVTVTFLQDAPAASGPNAGLQSSAVEAESGAAAAAAAGGQEGGADQQPKDVERVPYRFVRPEEVSATAVVEMRSIRVTPLPDAVKAASAAAAPSGGLSFSAAMAWRQGGEFGSATTARGIADAGAVSWPAVSRTFLDSRAFGALRSALEDGSPIYVELARYLANTDALTDPAFSNYHCRAELSAADLRALSTPGAVTLTCALSLEHTFAASETVAGGAGSSDAQSASALPGKQASAGKAKVLEAALPADASGSEACGWAGSTLSMEVHFSNAPVEAWTPPPKPSKGLREIVPERVTVKEEPAPDAAERFKAQCAGIVSALVAEYTSMFGKQSEGTTEPASQEEQDERQRQLVFELNRSGKYLKMRRLLKSSVVAVVKDKFRRSGTMSRHEMMDVYNDLYAFLADEMHCVLNQLSTDTADEAEEQAQGQSIEKLALLEQLAAECEVLGDFNRAEQLHQDRLALSGTPEMWYAYGAFCCRCGRLGKAEEAFRQAVATDGDHLPALLALACILWHNGVHTDALYLEAAESVAHAAIEAHENNAVAWALLAMISRARGENTSDQKRAFRNAKHRACEVAASSGHSALAQNAFLQLEILLLDLHFGRLANGVHALSLDGSTDALASELLLCEAQAAGLNGELAAARECIKKLMRACPGAGVKPLVVLGNLHSQAGKAGEAQAAYEEALKRAPEGCSLDVYIRLGNIYLEQGRYEFAADVFGQACVAQPCASAWYGAGIAALRLGQLSDADLAFTEANIHDNHHPGVWGHLALVQLLAENFTESDQALEFAYKAGITDVTLLKEIASIDLKQGRYLEAVQVLRRLTALQPDTSFDVHAMTAEALSELSEWAESRREWEKALAAAGDKTEANALAEAAIAAITDRLRDTGVRPKDSHAVVNGAL